MNYQWNWSLLLREPYAGWLLTGLGWTIALSIAGWLIALPLGTMIGIARTSSSRWVLGLSGFYVSVFRNIPLLLQMFVWFFVVPELLPARLGLWFKRDLPNPEFWTAALALAFYTSGRLAELFRAGMNRAQALRYIVMPQALRIILPPLTSEFLSIVKNSSLALTIGVLELTAQSRQIENFTFHGFEAFAAATAFYVLVALVLNLVMVRLQRTLALPVAV
jgi:glutamate/aspartate transport system permease protein